ncbi:helix-turn-helix domain-containing protein [Puniceibacterium sp. IMCC21224]|uniref:helix-turn-helix domain-containing protein n=1 Tax=Puniceibacterium sp. IMCC21224 TaxID=1618204 RepID=UPI00064DFDB0|nr:helix-turn-helix transcriptional regulator [Puniceibacterium sp. IMCC21224]KMK66512.1 putative transcriptional regulator (DUF2083)/Helix-turn-helix domain [Puniceibacterium sp. IMCC21224]
MPRDTLTGSRIRERRIMAGLRQTDLAKRAEISASYLNLIEHNRRRIGGTLLRRIAGILGVEQALLTDGAEATLVASLREVASDQRGVGAELDQVEEFAGRFPGWAALLAGTGRRVAALERTVETLTDRMTHDPHLAASLHEMLTTVTAIRSAASILAEPGEIEPEWQMRFHRNIYDDSARLAETSRGLVSYLEAADDASAAISVPQEEVDALLETAGHHFAGLEAGQTTPDALAEKLTGGASDAAQDLLRRGLQRYAEDVERLPEAKLRDLVTQTGPDPLALAQAAGVDPALAMRRLASLPEDVLADPVGLVICDASGTLTYRKPLPDFAMPRFGSACPLWPLYRALNRPGMMLAEYVAQPGRAARRFRAFALAQPVGPVQVNRDPLFQAHMLVVPDPAPAPASGAQTGLVGVTCRICSRSRCAGRREPSILGGPEAEEF